MIGVYYPYLEGAGKWEELRYSLRSLEMHFKEEYEVWIVGDLPEWIKGVWHIPHVKDATGPMASTCDAIIKLWEYLKSDLTPDVFVRMYDDIYFIGDRGLEDLKVTRYLFDCEDLKREGIKSGGALWREAVQRTVRATKRFGFEGIMTETHCPEVFEKKRMIEVFDLFEPLENRLLTSTLYYNVFPWERRLKDRKVERMLFYGYENEFSYSKPPAEAGGNSPFDFAQGPEGKFFLNHNDKGLDDGLKRWIERRFGKKSRWEK